MSKTTIEDPELVTKKRVSDDGRLWLGEDFAGKRYRVALELLEPGKFEGVCPDCGDQWERKNKEFQHDDCDADGPVWPDEVENDG